MLRTILVVVATLVVACGLMLGGVAVYNLGFQHGEQFAKDRAPPGKPCECRKCRCMSQGVPGDVATDAGLE